MMVCHQLASSESHIVVWCGVVAAFAVLPSFFPSFLLRIIRPSEERHANVFRGARDYAALLAAEAKRGVGRLADQYKLYLIQCFLRLK